MPGQHELPQRQQACLGRCEGQPIRALAVGAHRVPHVGEDEPLGHPRVLKVRQHCRRSEAEGIREQGWVGLARRFRRCALGPPRPEPLPLRGRAHTLLLCCFPPSSSPAISQQTHTGNKCLSPSSPPDAGSPPRVLRPTHNNTHPSSPGSASPGPACSAAAAPCGSAGCG